MNAKKRKKYLKGSEFLLLQEDRSHDRLIKLLAKMKLKVKKDYR